MTVRAAHESILIRINYRTTTRYGCKSRAKTKTPRVMRFMHHESFRPALDRPQNHPGVSFLDEFQIVQREGGEGCVPPLEIGC